MASYTVKNTEFRHAIEIQELTEEKDEDNFPIKEWRTVRKPKAKITHTSGSEKVESQENISLKSTKFVIRYSKNPNLCVPDATLRYRIVYNGFIYDIKAINNIAELNKYYQIIAEMRNTYD